MFFHNKLYINSIKYGENVLIAKLKFQISQSEILAKSVVSNRITQTKHIAAFREEGRQWGFKFLIFYESTCADCVCLAATCDHQGYLSSWRIQPTTLKHLAYLWAGAVIIAKSRVLRVIHNLRRE